MVNQGFIKKTRTSRLSRTPTMEPPLIDKSAEELFHFSHPHHPLFPVISPYLFSCICCREYGAGKRFSCGPCDVHLHEFCSSAPPSLQGHLFGDKHQLVFITKQGGFLRPNCDICAKPAKGCTFRCMTCNFEVHPVCTLLLPHMKFPLHSHPMSMSTTPASDPSAACAMCMRRRSGCVYHCPTCNNYCLHAVCAKDVVNGLYASGIRSPDKTNRFGKAAKVASHALFGLIGALIEGIGEGLGEALVDGIGRGRGGNRSIGNK